METSEPKEPAPEQEILWEAYLEGYCDRSKQPMNIPVARRKFESWLTRHPLAQEHKPHAFWWVDGDSIKKGATKLSGEKWVGNEKVNLNQEELKAIAQLLNAERKEPDRKEIGQEFIGDGCGYRKSAEDLKKPE